MNTLRDILALPFLALYAISVLLFVAFAWIAVSIGGSGTAVFLINSHRDWLK